MKITLTKPITLQSPTRDSKRKKTDLREVFNPDEDDSNTQVKKRKLVPLGEYFPSYSFSVTCAGYLTENYTK